MLSHRHPHRHHADGSRLLPSRQLFGRHFTDARGCELKSTFYVSSWFTDWEKVHAFWADGHEIALHTITVGAAATLVISVCYAVHHRHRTCPQHETNYRSDYDRWFKELEGSRLATSRLAQIPEHHITGSRSPFLEYSGRYMKALHDLGFTYESTMREYGIKADWRSLISDGPGNKIWPYTLDYGAGQNCEIEIDEGKCSTGTWSFPGLWEVPLWSLDTVSTGAPMSLMDEGNWELLRTNFLARYNGNRVPMGLFCTSHAWRCVLLRAACRRVLLLMHRVWVAQTTPAAAPWAASLSCWRWCRTGRMCSSSPTRS